MVDLARENRAQTAATQQNLLTESYYGLRLAQQIVTVREETYKYGRSQTYTGCCTKR